MPDSSRVWVYQSSRKFTPSEAALLQTEAEQFAENWTAHQAGLKASVKVWHDRFIVFAVDESHNDASGCSIDKKVAFLKMQEQKLGTGFFERMNVAILSDAGEIKLVRLQDLNGMYSSGLINSSTMVFDNLVSTMAEFRNSWLNQIKNTWMMNFVSAAPVA